MGFGVGLNFEILVLVVQNEFPASAVGMATAATGFFRKVGSVLGTSVVGALFTSGLARALAERLAPVGGVGALGTDANLLTPAIVHALAPRTCAMRWAPPTATRSRPCSGSRCRWPWRASCSCCSCARRGWPPPWTDRGMGPTKARTSPRRRQGARRR